MPSTDIFPILNSHYCTLELHSDLSYAFHRPCSPSQQSFLRVKAPFCSSCAFHRPFSRSQQSLLQIRAQLCYFYEFHRPGSHCRRSLLRIQAIFCFMPSTGIVYILNSHFCASKLHSALLVPSSSPFSHSQQSLLHIRAQRCSFMHSTDLTLTATSRYWASTHHSALLMHSGALALNPMSH